MGALLRMRWILFRREREEVILKKQYEDFLKMRVAAGMTTRLVQAAYIPHRQTRSGKFVVDGRVLDVIKYVEKLE
jgi:hypothetical protein